MGKRLLEASRIGDTEEVRNLMASGAPFTTDWLGTSPLHFASQNGHLQTAEVLLRAGISRDARTKVDRTPLHVAAQAGHADIVRLLLKSEADIEAKDMLKMTPLHWATEESHPLVIELLVREGAQIHTENKFGKSPLDIAGDKGRFDLIGLLSQNGEIQVAANSVVEEVTAEEILTEQINHHTETVITEEVESEPITDDIPVSIATSIAMTTSDSSDQSSTSVLATLAALAEATAPITSLASNTTEAINLLENHGITMISTNDGNILASAVESGQSITLTEAGRVAINLIKQQALNQSTDKDGEGEVIEENVVDGYGTVADDLDPEKVIMVSEDQLDGEESGQVVVEVQEETAEDMTHINAAGDACSDEPPMKRIKSDSVSHFLVKNQILEGPMKDDLRKQLEEVQRQAEEYKQQLLEKEKETEVYKKRLSELTPTKKKT